MRGRHSEKVVHLSLFLKVERADMDEKWQGSLFQIFEATDDNDLDFPIAFFLCGAHIDKEKDRCYRVGI